MQTLSRNNYLAFSLFICSLFLSSYSFATPQNGELATNKNSIIRVGIYAPFANKDAYLGRNILAAMEIGRDQLTASNIKYKFYTLDRLPKQIDAPKTLQKFVDIRHINVLITEGTVDGMAAAKVAKTNNIIHFSIASNPEIADGKNNFLALPPVLATIPMQPEFIAQFKESYMNAPVVEAGYAFGVFQMMHQGIALAMADQAEFSSMKVSQHIIAQGKNHQAIGSLDFNKKGVLFTHLEVKPENKMQVLVG